MVLLAAFLIPVAGCDGCRKKEATRPGNKIESDAGAGVEDTSRRGGRQGGRMETEDPARGQGWRKQPVASDRPEPATEPGTGFLAQEVPAYPNADLVYSNRKDPAHQLFRFRSSDQPSDVRDYYFKQLPQEGWEMGQVEESPGFIQIAARKEGSKAVLTLKQENGQTSVDLVVLPVREKGAARGRQGETEVQLPSRKGRGAREMDSRGKQ